MWGRSEQATVEEHVNSSNAAKVVELEELCDFEDAVEEVVDVRPHHREASREVGTLLGAIVRDEQADPVVDERSPFKVVERIARNEAARAEPNHRGDLVGVAGGAWARVVHLVGERPDKVGEGEAVPLNEVLRVGVVHHHDIISTVFECSVQVHYRRRNVILNNSSINVVKSRRFKRIVSANENDRVRDSCMPRCERNGIVVS